MNKEFTQQDSTNNLASDLHKRVIALEDRAGNMEKCLIDLLTELERWETDKIKNNE